MLRMAFAFCFFFSFSFFFHAFLAFRDKFYCSRMVAALFVHCSWDPQPLYSKKYIKNGSHGTIHTFKNYFVTVFSVFSF